MLGVTTVRSGSALDAGVAEQVDETVVITSGEELAIAGASDGVDVSAITALGVDTLGVPRELDSLGGPDDGGGIAATRLVLLAVGHFEEEQLVSTTVGADVVGLRAPVQSHDVRVVTAACSLQGEAVVQLVDVDVVVVGTDSEPLVIGREGHDLNPLVGVAKLMSANAGA